jgi:RIO kinase 1
VKTGKEASVYRANLDGEPIALKVYTPLEERSFRNSSRYLAGAYYRSASERRAAAKGNGFGRNAAHIRWVAREFYLLSKARKFNLPVPEPLLLLSSAVCMRYLGEADVAAPRLHEVELSLVEARACSDALMSAIATMWRDMGIAHGDLSPYNILWWQEQAWIIDFPQAADRRTHPEARAMLERDVANVVRYFERYFLIDTQEFFRSLDS